MYVCVCRGRRLRRVNLLQMENVMIEVTLQTRISAVLVLARTLDNTFKNMDEKCDIGYRHNGWY
jgi:hypothetical protein